MVTFSKRRTRALLKSLGFLVVIIGLIVVFSIWSPSQLVARVGVGTSLLLAAVFSVLGGVSSFTSATYYAVIGSMALGGVPVPLLMIVCGPALLLGDLFFYWFGRTAHDALSPRIQGYLDKAEAWIQKTNNNWVQVGIMLYTGVSPFPGDILMISLALSAFPFRRMLLPLLLGNMILVWTIASVARGGQTLLGLF
jgi:membrane protein YqaA with SNARE-associated domain